MFPVLGGAPGGALMDYAVLDAETELELALPLCSPPLPDVYAYWKSLAGSGQAPCRADFDPLAIAGGLPDVFLVAVDASDYRFTVVGGRIEERLGVRLTQQPLSACAGLLDLERTRRDFDAMARHPIPRLERVSGDWTDYDWRRFERLMLPLVDETGALAHILGAVALCIEDQPADGGYPLCEASLADDLDPMNRGAPPDARSPESPAAS